MLDVVQVSSLWAVWGKPMPPAPRLLLQLQRLCPRCLGMSAQRPSPASTKRKMGPASPALDQLRWTAPLMTTAVWTRQAVQVRHMICLPAVSRPVVYL